jgi:pilus assembly protein Flp/PilA
MWRDERGVTAIEYAILAAVVVVAVVAAGSALSSTTGGLPWVFSQLMTSIEGQVSGAAPANGNGNGNAQQ